jgi:hypothetical protein
MNVRQVNIIKPYRLELRKHQNQEVQTNIYHHFIIMLCL